MVSTKEGGFNMNLNYPNMKTTVEIDVSVSTKHIVDFFCAYGIPKEKADDPAYKQGFKQAIEFLLSCDYLQDIEEDEAFREYMADKFEGVAYERSLR